MLAQLSLDLSCHLSNHSRSIKHPFDTYLYRRRHLIEYCFSKLKQCRRVAKRFKMAARNYPTIITPAATVHWLR
jgi:transposase